MSKILFPTDFSKHSIQALSDTVQINQHLNYEVVVFHAYSRPFSESYDQIGLLETAEKNIEHRFKSIEKEIPDLKNQKHSFVKKLGDFLDQVEELMKRETFALVVLSTKGALGLGELFGTKTTKLIKSVNVPVIVLPANCSLFPMKKVGLACDYSQETPLEKLKLLTDLCEVMELELDLITLNRDARKMTKDELKNRDSLLNKMTKLTYKTSFTKNDNVAWGLIEYAKSNEVNMIGVIPKSYNYLERLFHESLTKNMTFHSPVPLFVLQ